MAGRLGSRVEPGGKAALDKCVVVRRRAQQLARAGQLTEAVEEMGRLLLGGEPDPYDYVFHGDLLDREGKSQDAIDSYEEAISAYERVGLFRNAIAVAKRVLRTDAERARTYRRLGDLYSKEGLIGDAVTCYLNYLDRAGGEAGGEEFIEVLERVAQLSGPRVEVALRLAELYIRAGRQDRAAHLLEGLADQAAGAGGFEIASALRERANALCLTVDDACGQPPQILVEAPEPNAISTGGDACDAMDPRDAQPTEVAPAPLPPNEELPEDGAEAAARLRRGMIEEAIGRGDPERARELLLRLLDESPNDLWAAEKLVAVHVQLGDKLAAVRQLSLLGDLLITREDYEGALRRFLEVLDLDPGDATAQRRIARFREMGLAVPEGGNGGPRGGPETRPGMSGATVCVSDRESVGTEEWVDLAALLDEFRAGVRELVSSGDHEGHYDLGVSHLEMGLLEEAVEEFGVVLATPDLPAEMALKVREMRGRTLQRLDRPQEAVREYRAALDVPERPDSERRPVAYQMACLLEEIGESEEARALFRGLAAKGAFLDSQERLARLGG